MIAKRAIGSSLSLLASDLDYWAMRDIDEDDALYMMIIGETR